MRIQQKTVGRHNGISNSEHHGLRASMLLSTLPLRLRGTNWSFARVLVIGTVSDPHVPIGSFGSATTKSLPGRKPCGFLSTFRRVNQHGYRKRLQMPSLLSIRRKYDRSAPTHAPKTMDLCLPLVGFPICGTISSKVAENGRGF